MGRAKVKAQALAGGGSAFLLAAASRPAPALEPAFATGVSAHDSLGDGHANPGQAGLRADRDRHPERLGSAGLAETKNFPATGRLPFTATKTPDPQCRAPGPAAQHERREMVLDVLRLQPPHIPDPPFHQTMRCPLFSEFHPSP